MTIMTPSMAHALKRMEVLDESGLITTRRTQLTMLAELSAAYEKGVEATTEAMSHDMMERHLITACAQRYLADIRKACAEDQDGNEDGAEGTTGHDMQVRLRAIINHRNFKQH